MDVYINDITDQLFPTGYYWRVLIRIKILRARYYLYVYYLRDHLIRK